MRTSSRSRNNARSPKGEPKDKRRRPPAKSRPMRAEELEDFEERVVRKNQPEPLPPKRLIPT